MTGSIILGITFGIDVQPQNDPHIVLAETALQSMAAVGNVGSYMGKCTSRIQSLIPLICWTVDYLPLCKYTKSGLFGIYSLVIPVQYLPNWAPGAQFKRDAAEWKKSVVAMYEKPFQFVKRGLVRLLHSWHWPDLTVNAHRQAEGNAPPSIAASLLAKLGGDQDAARRESVIRHVTGTAYVGKFCQALTRISPYTHRRCPQLGQIRYVGLLLGLWDVY